MIRPRLPRVASGTRLTTDLVNGIINRTEYAADLLRQYKLVAGTEMYVEPHYDGTRVSYLQPVGGGATPSPIERKLFRIITNSGFIYEPLPTESYIEVPNKIIGDNFYGIAGNIYFGYFGVNPYTPPFSQGLIIIGEKRNEILFGDYTRIYGGDENFAIGETFVADGPPEDISTFGFKCNLDGSGFETISVPNTVPTGQYKRQIVFLSDIHNGNIIGDAYVTNTNNQTFYFGPFLRNSSGDFINLPHFAWKIYGDYITLQPSSGTHKLYQISTGQTTEIFYNGQNTRLFGIYKNIVNGDTSGAINTNFLYNINDGSFTDIYALGEDMG